MPLGLEILDAGAIAVSVGDEGVVRARAAESGADIAAAAFASLGKAGHRSDMPVGVAAVSPDAAATIGAMKALAARLPEPLVHDPPIPSGTAAAVAEAWAGAGKGARDIVYFAASDHAIGGILRGGAPLIGASGRAPAIAWLALNPVEREDYRKIGCLEAEVAAAGIVRRLIWRIKAGDRSRAEEVVGGELSNLSVQHVLAAARDGDGVCISVLRDTAKYLGMAAANLVVVADPQVLVLGGFMASAADLLLDPVRIEIARRLPAAMTEALTIVPATLGADAPAIGAARLAALR
jgi:predicted NBD/HSP70 family sugar kinase